MTLRNHDPNNFACWLKIPNRLEWEKKKIPKRILLRFCETIKFLILDAGWRFPAPWSVKTQQPEDCASQIFQKSPSTLRIFKQKSRIWETPNISTDAGGKIPKRIKLRFCDTITHLINRPGWCSRGCSINTFVIHSVIHWLSIQPGCWGWTGVTSVT